MFESCIVGDCDYEGVFLEERFLKGRKEYVCCECFRPILYGERHYRAKGIFDGGGFWEERTCKTCHDIRRSLYRGSWVYGELWEMVLSHYCKSREDALAMIPDQWIEKRDYLLPRAHHPTPTDK